jgi:hypothetical protein
MMKRLMDNRVAKAKDQRYGAGYNFGATYYDARDEAIRRGDRTIGTEHLLLALLVDPASPAARALGHDLESARHALDVLDEQALSAIGVEPGITAGPIAVRTRGGLRLTPAAKAVFRGIPKSPRSRGAGLGKVLYELLELRTPDAAAELLCALDVNAQSVRERFAELERGEPG